MKVLQIGAGGVGSVVAHKLAMNEEFSSLLLASRTIKKCDDIKESIYQRFPNTALKITTATLDADDINAVVKLINEFKPFIVLNMALPYQDLTIMQACLDAKVHYLDTANYEHKDIPSFEYDEQWKFHEPYKKAGIFGLLGAGFDPGVTNVFCAYVAKKYFDVIEELEIYDCNDGKHPYPFATNFNTEVNLREVSAKGRYFNNNTWIQTEPMEIKVDWEYPEIGVRSSYLLYHEELESLVKHFKTLKKAKFFMTFSESYLRHMNVLENVGMLDIKPVKFQGHDIVPLEFLKSMLPDPSSLASVTKGKTNIGCVVKGTYRQKHREIYIYNVCDHEKCFKEVGSQAVSYTTGVGAITALKLIAKKLWHGPLNLDSGVYNLEQNNPIPFIEEMSKQGLNYKVQEVQDGRATIIEESK